MSLFARVHELLQLVKTRFVQEPLKTVNDQRTPAGKGDGVLPTPPHTLNTEDKTVHASSAAISDESGAANEQVIEQLLAMMETADVYYLSAQPASTLTKLGKPGILALLKATQFKGYGVAAHASETLSGMGQAAVAPLIEVLEGDSAYASAAATCLGNIHDPAAIPELLEALRHQEVAVRVAAAKALGHTWWSHGRKHLDSLAPDVVSALVEALNDSVTSVRSNAARALGYIGASAKDAVPALLQAADNPELRAEAVTALGDIWFYGRRDTIVECLDSLAPDVVPALVEALNDSASSVRSNAARALGYIGAPAKDAVPALIQAADNPELRAEAVTALGKIGPASHTAVPLMIKALKDADTEVRWSAAWALGDIGPPASPAVPALVKALRWSEWPMQFRVAVALGHIGDTSAVPALMRALHHKHEQVRSSAAFALGQLGASTAIPVLIKALLKDKEITVRWGAAQALGMLGKVGDARVTSALIEALRTDKNVGARRYAARALGNIGDRMSVPALMEALADEDELVRSEAAAALKLLRNDDE
jgi:HEAT repeat protein